ncbi:MAG: hypothetical protein INR71_00660 [Terriglobus roseus]|nr:hypothetical protein [Terriglobus roseus]
MLDVDAGLLVVREALDDGVDLREGLGRRCVYLGALGVCEGVLVSFAAAEGAWGVGEDEV